MKKIFITALLLAGFNTQGFAETKMIELPASCEDKGLNIIVCPIDDAVTMDDAVASMKLRANGLNFKLVAEMPLSEQVKAMGEESRRMEIFQFCDALIAKRMVEYNVIFAGFLPCRIAMVEAKDGKASLVTLNMDAMLKGTNLPDDLKPLGLTVRNSIYSIIQAGVEGDL
jgi:uncharacterized protein (DUF302 family)